MASGQFASVISVQLWIACSRAIERSLPWSAVGVDQGSLKGREIGVGVDDERRTDQEISVRAEPRGIQSSDEVGDLLSVWQRIEGDEHSQGRRPRRKQADDPVSHLECPRPAEPKLARLTWLPAVTLSATARSSLRRRPRRSAWTDKWSIQVVL